MVGVELIHVVFVLICILVTLLGVAAGSVLFARLVASRRGDQGIVGSRRVSEVALSVIIPARNEERNLPHLLSSLSRELPGRERIELIVVDDESSDRTRAVAEGRRCRVVAAGKRPPGWTGKAWACWRGAAEATGTVFLFLDADTWLLPGGLTRLTELFSLRRGVISMQPYHRMSRPIEHLSFFFNLTVMGATGAFSLLPVRRRPDGAFGPCLMISRDDYFRAGGHEAVRGSLIEDMALGRRCASQGIRVSLIEGRGIIEYRMYPGGLREIVEGWTKNLTAGASTAPGGVAALLSIWLAGAAAAAILLLLLVWGATTRELGPALWVAGALSYFVYAGGVGVAASRIGSFGALSAVGFPLHFLFFCFILGRSLFQHFVKRTVIWKGREIQTGTDVR